MDNMHICGCYTNNALLCREKINVSVALHVSWENCINIWRRLQITWCQDHNQDFVCPLIRLVFHCATFDGDWEEIWQDDSEWWMTLEGCCWNRLHFISRWYLANSSEQVSANLGSQKKKKKFALEDVNDMTITNFSLPHTLQRKYKLDN
jgi:hypothetical protein